MIHSEVMTHRVFSRSASSSRAIPTKEMVRRVREDPALPLSWGRNQKGMQAGQELNEDLRQRCLDVWLQARDQAVCRALELLDLGLHKQIASRVLEPFAHIEVVLTATDFTNFFALRVHEDAQPEFQFLAAKMALALQESDPSSLHEGEWHLPYVRPEERTGWDIESLLSFSVARSARVSYAKHGGAGPDPDDDLRLARRLLEAGHFSPYEHQARAKRNWGHSGNFQGWDQFRQLLPASSKTHFDFTKATRILSQFSN